MNRYKEPTHLLLVEDSPSLSAVYRSYLEDADQVVQCLETGREALNLLEEEKPDLILLDLKLPDMSGIDVLREIAQRDIDVGVIIITAHGSIDVAVEAMHNGALDFLTKPFDAPRLQITVRNALARIALSSRVEQYEKVFDRTHFHSFIGKSLVMQAVYRTIESAAPSKATVFITGESGTGKELCARSIHDESKRATGPFIPINCAAIPRDLIESELFGHVKGAFSGASSNRDGAAHRADGGTLFLDEICEMELELQSKLLRFIQTGRFQRVGGSGEEQVDIRIVCATNRSPLEAVRANRFREDLYYRLNVIPLELPPLRDRDSDIALLAQHMLEKMSKEEGKSFADFSPEALQTLTEYPWPGNVRELENMIRNIVVLHDAERVTHDLLPEAVYTDVEQTLQHNAVTEMDAVSNLTETRFPVKVAIHEIRPLWLQEKEIIEKSITLCGGNVPKAAALLEISASTIYRKRAAWNSSCKRQSRSA